MYLHSLLQIFLWQISHNSSLDLIGALFFQGNLDLIIPEYLSFDRSMLIRETKERRSQYNSKNLKEKSTIKTK